MKRFWLVLSVILTGLLFSCSGPESKGWISLFDGKTLEGWKASENPGSVTVVDGQIVCNGPRSHLFYEGQVNNGDFKNFELKADVMTTPGANSGIYFHTEYQETGWPAKGYEVQVNNTHTGEDGYYEFKKTGSLYAIRNVYKQLANDNEWFSLYITVKGKHVTIKVNDILVVDYIEPDSVVRTEEMPGRLLSHGTFAIQIHDPKSLVYFKNIFVRPLPDEVVDPVEAHVVDKTYSEILLLNMTNFPIVDFHVHIKGDLTLESVMAKSRTDGINYGIAPNCGVGFPIQNDAQIDEYLESMKGVPAFMGMQAEGREWITMFSKEAIAKFDYVFTDAMTFTDDFTGKRTRLWLKDEVTVTDPEKFMDMLVQKILGVLNNEPVDIYVNPTYLPEVISTDYDKLWTPERMNLVVDALVKNDIALEINNRFKIPSAAFVKLAKEKGVKFTFGTNNTGSEDLNRLEYCLAIKKECNLTAKDMFLPRHDGQKKVQLLK